MTEKNNSQNRIRDALSRIYDGQPPYFREYLRRYKEDPKSRVFAPLAEAYRRMGKVEEAIAICREGLTHHPEFTGGRVALAKCYMDKKQFSEAKLELEKIIDQVPENLLAQRLLGDTYQALDDSESALHCYKMALLLSPSDVALAERVKKLEMDLKETALVESSIEMEEPGREEEELEQAEAFAEAEASEPSVTETHFLAPEEKEPAITRQEAELIPVLSEDGKIEMVPFTDEKNLSSVDRLLGIKDSDPDDDAFSVGHVSKVFEGNQKKSEITTETLGDLYYSQGQYDRAIRIFEKIRQARPGADLDRKIEACRNKLGVEVDDSMRGKKIEMLQGILGKLKETKQADGEIEFQ
ncbi:MAG: tetratricopeptide repeat protein [Bdellovibrionales bacterium]|nr:tetratricopeptide repeat protein [Bdellovibrionales bacterium]